MNTKVYVAVLLLAIVALSGCVEKEVTHVTYVSEGGSILYLFSDGTYIDDPIDDYMFHGNYTYINLYGDENDVVNDTLFLKFSMFGFDGCFKMVPDGADYIDEEGERWTLHNKV